MRVWPVPELDYRPLGEIDERRDVALVYSHAAREAVARPLAHLSVVSSVEPRTATEDEWRQLAASCMGDVVYSVGGGLATDAAKYIATRRDLPLVCIPTALSVDAFFTWASGVRRDGCVTYITTKPPDRVVVDLRVVADAPPSVRAAGIGDVLSIAQLAGIKRVDHARVRHYYWTNARRGRQSTVARSQQVSWASQRRHHPLKSFCCRSTIQYLLQALVRNR